MNQRFLIGHIGIHVRQLEEELEFLKLLGATVTSIDALPCGRVAFVSLDGDTHHNLALFENGQGVPNGDSKKERHGVHHIALRVKERTDVDSWVETLQARGVSIDGPHIQGPEGGGLEGGSSSYSIFFTDPQGICFEIFSEPMTVAEFNQARAAREGKHD